MGDRVDIRERIIWKEMGERERRSKKIRVWFEGFERCEKETG
jgi:hypothetical protein